MSVTLLVALTSWKESDDGKGKRTRLVIAADSMNWQFGTQSGKEDAAVSGASYYGGMRHILLKLWDEKPALFNPCVKKIVASLSERTGIAMPTYTLPDTRVECEALGRLIDSTFQTSFPKESPPKVFKRIFGAAAKATEPEEESES